MLDAFIIDRIRHERQNREPARLPLKVEIPEMPMHREDGHREDGRSEERRREDGRRPDDDQPERGVVIIDFGI